MDTVHVYFMGKQYEVPSQLLSGICRKITNHSNGLVWDLHPASITLLKVYSIDMYYKICDSVCQYFRFISTIYFASFSQLKVMVPPSITMSFPALNPFFFV